jgi:fructokinase
MAGAPHEGEGRRVFAGIELGGTKTVCAVGTCPTDLVARTEFPTTEPETTLREVAGFFRPHKFERAGVAAFGPVDLRASSKTYGHILKTPKEAWRRFDLAGSLRSALDTEIRIDTDVGCAALGEMTWGAARGLQTFLYVTVGTGIGGGAYVNGQPLHGLLHPEMGHLRIPRDPNDEFPGSCPSHVDCLEGLAAGHSMEKRWGASPRTLPPDHAAWTLETRYLATAIVNWLLTLSPECIILGGGIMERISLDALRARVLELLNDYCDAPPLVRPALGRDSGVLGAIALAAQPTL